MNQTLYIAGALRQALESMEPDTDWSRALGGACGVASAALVRLLRRRGIPATLTLGEYAPPEPANYGGDHCWVVLSDESTLDVTATQFDAALPKVYHSLHGQDHGYAPWLQGLCASRHLYGVWYQYSNNHLRAEINQAVRRTEKLLLVTRNTPSCFTYEPQQLECR